MEDILELAAIHDKAMGVRGYFILENLENYRSVRLAMVPVSNEGKDMLTRIADDGSEESAIYDFTQPCPHLCDDQSPLYK